jgi:hypothetical protein
MMDGAIATARMCGQRVRLTRHQRIWSFRLARSRSGGFGRQSRTPMSSSSKFT